MPDVLLIQPPIRDFYLTAKRTIPYGPACIAAALEQAGFSVEILDALAVSKSRNVDLPAEMAYLREFFGRPDTSPFALFHRYRHYGYDFRRIGESAGKSRAFLVGISSLFTAYSEEALSTAEVVREYLPDCRIVMGGHHPTQMPERVLEHSAVDFVLRGEGEESMPALAAVLRNAGRFDLSMPVESIPGIDSVPGIAYRGTDGSFRIGPPAVVEDLDACPLPAIHLLNHRFYRRGQGRKHGFSCDPSTSVVTPSEPSLPGSFSGDAPFPPSRQVSRGSAVVVAGRGCPLHCAYCCVGSGYTGFRQRSVESVLLEIERAVHDFGARFIDFEDENISFRRGWFMDLLQGIKERFLGLDLELRAMNGLFPPTLDDETIRAMKEAGFTALNLSLCTTSAEQLKRFRRPDVRDGFEPALESAGRYGLDAVGYIIVGAPGQSAEDSVRDLLYLANKRVVAGVSVYYPAPGSADYRMLEKSGLLPEKFSLMRSTAVPVADPASRTDIVTLMRLGRILNFMKSFAGESNAPPRIAPPGKTRMMSDLTGPRNRIEAGKTLLDSFLADGRIKGVTPDGEIYEHRASERLCRLFIEGLENTCVTGV